MRSLLHLITRPEDPLPQEIIRQQQAMAGLEVRVLDLTQGETDYGKLVESIFAADSVQVW